MASVHATCARPVFDTCVLARAVSVVLVALSALGALNARADSATASTSTLYCPADMEIVDVDATTVISLKAGEAPPLVIVLDPVAADGVVTAFTEAFERTREAFLSAMEGELGVRRLDALAVIEPPFREFRARFQAENASFPVSAILGQTWAKGVEGDTVRDRITTLLRSVQRDHLIGDVRPASTVFVLNAASVSPAKAWGEVVARSRTVTRDEILSLDEAGEYLRRMNDPLDRAASGFLSGLLRANVSEDKYLTGLLLQDRMGAATVHRWFSRGEPLVRAGQVPDRWAMLALSALQRQGMTPLHEPLPVLESPVADVRPVVKSPGSAPTWLWWTGTVGAGLSSLMLAWVGYIFVQHRRRGHVVVAGGPEQGFAEALVPHFARELKDRLIRALFTQRSVLLANEQAASRRVQEMEERLARLQPAIAERIRSYEQRIEALEKEIAERDVETRDLIRAKLVLARKELDAEIARNRIDWN